MLKIEILHIDECPNWHQTEDRLRSVLAELGASTVAVDTKLLVTRDEAAAVAFAGSPTILIDGTDAFPSKGATSDLPCRVYFTENGLAGLPSETQLRDVLSTHL
jgi:hypothetical protein